MYVLDKAAFGAFLAQQRKLKGFTQREVAEQLFVSDKAVSKWERGLSMPDIALLIPLSQLLDVSVAELLEGRRLESGAMDAVQVETLVQRALAFSEDTAQVSREMRLRRALAFSACALLGLLGMAALCATPTRSVLPFLLAPLLLSLIFGVYLFFFAKERLPAYYDENRISTYSDGMFQLNLPGVRLDNGNWRAILRAGRIWSCLTLPALPLAGFALTHLPMEHIFWFSPLLLVLYLGGLFIPMYITAKRHGRTPTEKRPRRRWTIVLLILLAGLLLPLGLYGGLSSEFRSGMRIGYVSMGGRQEWSASYLRLDGTMRRRLFAPAGAAYELTVQTDQGTLSVTMTDRSGKTVFAQENLASGVYALTLPGTVWVRIEAQGHQGSFSIRKKP